MKPPALFLLTLLSVVALCCVAFVVWRLHRLAAQRADAEQRAAVAFAELNRLTTELRRRHEDEATEQAASLPPGERLRRRYPGSAPRGQPS